MRAELYLVLAAIFWGLNFHFAKFMMAESSYIEAATWRYVFAVVTLLLIGFKSLRAINFRHLSIKGIVLVGFVGLFGFNLLFFKGLNLSDSINASLLVNLNPIMTIMLASWLIGTKITRYHIIGAGISLSGVAYLLFQGDLSNVASLRFNYGDLLVFLAGIIFALYNVWIKMCKGQMSDMNFTTLTNAFCLFGFILIMPAQAESITLDHSYKYWAWSLGIGTVGTALAYYFYNKGITMIGPEKASMYLNLVPLTAVLCGVCLGQTLYLYHIISCIIILSGVYIAQRSVSV